MFRRFLFITPFFFTFFFMSSPAFAVDDWSFTTTSSTSAYFCGYPGTATSSRNTEPCSSYRYLIIDWTGDHINSDSQATRINISGDISGSSATSSLRFPSTYSITDISYFSNFHLDSISYIPSSFSVTFTVTSSLPSDDSPCPVCPVIPENPYDNKFDEVVTAIYTCGAIMLVLYFFYSIYRVIIKTTGGF